MKMQIELLLLAGLGLAKVYPNGRIVGGYEVSPAFKYPWMTALFYYTEHMCGGTVYNENTVITAAHCDIGNMEAWSAKFHRHNLVYSEAKEQGSSSKILERASHPLYNKQGNTEYDVSLWKVKGAPSSQIQLDSGMYSKTSTLLTVIGWGDTYNGGTGSNKLLEIKVPVYDSRKCEQSYTNLDTSSQFCAGYPEGGKDSCQGDSGGPIFVKTSGEYTLVGVVSWGRGCADPGFPGIYTSIAKVKSFVKNYSF